VDHSSPWRRRWNDSAYTDAVEGPLKERLTGALIVVAVLVVVVPEMLSGPGKSSAAAKSGSDAGPPVRTYSLELGSSDATRTQGQSTLTPQSSESATPPVAAAPVATPQAAPPTPTAATEPSPAPADDKPAVASAADVPAKAAPAASAEGQWWTQLGSFSARDNAERLARDLRGKGYTITVARIKVKSKDLYRVRAGPAGSREAALALQSRLAAAGHKSSLVPP
jgi:DedD protein